MRRKIITLMYLPSCQLCSDESFCAARLEATQDNGNMPSVNSAIELCDKCIKRVADVHARIVLAKRLNAPKRATRTT